MCCPWLCSHGGWLLLKCSAIGIGFNGAETNCGIAHILGILLMNSYDTYFLATAIIFRLFTLNIYAQFYASPRRVQTCQITEANRSHKKPDWQAILFQSRMHFFSLPRKKKFWHPELVLSTCCFRVSKKCPVISQKLAEKLLKNQWKVAFCIESCSKVAQRNKHFFGLILKYANCTTKVKISKHFCASWRRNKRC